jgi:hypothetical protein
MRTPQAEWVKIRQRFLENVRRRGVNLTLRDRVWAVTPDERWVAIPGTSDSPVADKWWLGCDPEKLRTRRPIAVVLLCQARGGSVHAISLPATAFRAFEGRLSRNPRQVFFNVMRRGPRFILQLRGGEELDVTNHVNDLSWASGKNSSALYPATSHESPASDVARETAAAEPAESLGAFRFFAVAEKGNLRPLDEVALEPGSFYLVEAKQVPAVPATRALRRILARGGPADLPSDLAEEHDHYAHGAARR